MTDIATTFARRLQPLEPLPCGIEPRFANLPDTRAVVFDVYGTMLISGSGDIGLSSDCGRARALSAALAHFGIRPERPVAEIAAAFAAAIQTNHAAARARGIDFPEIDIRDIWRELGIIPEEHLEDFAIEFECLTNSIWPMPQLRETLQQIHRSGLLLGIVSNAQFYTPLSLAYFLKAPLAHVGFSPDLCVYSFEYRIAKPSTALFQQLLRALQARGVAPRQCLFIGNDQRNDIWPAQACGLKTALFAGDQRSLRLRTDDPRCAGIVPDAILTELSQIPQLLTSGI